MEINKVNIDKWFSFIRDSKVLIIGDIIMDVYIQGNVTRISPEAPVPVVNVTSKKSCLGGAANVVINLAAMGAKPILCGFIGDDVRGYEFIKSLEDLNISTKGLCMFENRNTTSKTRIIGNKIQLLRMDEEQDDLISEEETEMLYSNILNIITTEDIKAIIFEDYDKGIISKALIDRVVSLSQQYSIPVCVDPKKQNFLHYNHITLFKPNLVELSFGLQLNKNQWSLYEMVKSIQEFMEEKQHQIVMTTLSDKGIIVCYYKDSEFTYHWIPAMLRNIVDVSGAGDTVISIATLALIFGFPPRQVAELSNIAGGLVCEYMGVGPIDTSRFYPECITMK